MDRLDLREKASSTLESAEGEIMSIIQLIVDEDGNGSACIGGDPKLIVESLSRVIRNNNYIKHLFMAALSDNIN